MTNSKNNVRQMPKPLTEEEKKQQVLRFLAQKRESYIQLILANILRQQGMGPKEAVDLAIEGADYMMSKMYTEEKPTEE